MWGAALGVNAQAFAVGQQQGLLCKEMSGMLHVRTSQLQLVPVIPPWDMAEPFSQDSGTSRSMCVRKCKKLLRSEGRNVRNSPSSTEVRGGREGMKCSRCQSRDFFTVPRKTRNRYFLQLLENMVEQISTLHTWRTPCVNSLAEAAKSGDEILLYFQQK